MTSLPKTFKAAVFESAGPDVVLRNVPMVKPGPGELLVKVLACGICHTDKIIGDGAFGHVFPRISGHEIVGDVVQVGEGCMRFSAGERVGGAWHGGHDGTCRSCQRGDFQICSSRVVNGLSKDGGFAEYTILRDEAAVHVPGDMDVAEVAPLLCAGVTVFNGMRNMSVRPGSVVAVQGLGGLGHLAVQYANKMGFRVVAISSSDRKKKVAADLGAHHYINASKEDAVARLNDMGGADMIVSTAPEPASITSLVRGLGAKGKLLCLAPVGEILFDATHLIKTGASVHGWPSGNQLDSEETIDFSRLQGVKCMVERFKLEDAAKAIEHMASGNVRFRAVIVME